jgi:DNA-binding HxlR family transcriptional regulator
MKEVNGCHSKIACTKVTKLLGDYWVLSIIAVLGDESLRFCELQRRLQMVNPVTLTNRLQQLEESKLVERRTGLVDEILVTYSLTSLGKDALLVVDALNAFAMKSAKALL